MKEFNSGHPIIRFGDLDPAPIDTRAIRDPIDESPEVFAEVYERIEHSIIVLAAALVTW